MNIEFEKLTHRYQRIIFDWLVEPHMLEFWDNSQEHKDDIIHYINGRKGEAPYFKGIFDYWVGSIDRVPYSFLLTSEMQVTQENISRLHRAYLSKTGKTITIDFGVGNKDFLGKGLGAPTLIAFTEFYQNKVDCAADTFFIDPDENNPRAQHVYKKAGFELAGEFDMANGVFKGNKSFLMVKKLSKIV